MDKKRRRRHRRDIKEKRTSLGIEFGSTRIKAVLIGEDHTPIAQGSHEWENQFVDDLWTYSLEAVWAGVQDCFRMLRAEVEKQYRVTLTSVGSIGISAMMHGYLVFDENEKLLVPFRTWRNTNTGKASRALTQSFGFPIPHRWSIAHLYEAILNEEPHVDKIRHLTTLAGYVHWKLTGQRVVGIGEASGIFPIDSSIRNYDREMIARFGKLVKDKGVLWSLEELLPHVLMAGDPAGSLTGEGARLLDPTGSLREGIPLCPPEGDAGAGMAATNSVTPGTGNVSAGTSIFIMAVLHGDLKKVHPEIDLITTPVGEPVAMVHCNNCTGDIDGWCCVFEEFCAALGVSHRKPAIYDLLYNAALQAEPDAGGVFACNYISGESITDIHTGRPLLVRGEKSCFSLNNLMRANLFSALATLKIGMDILFGEEGVRLHRLCGHGGFFKTKLVGQRMLAAAADTPVTVMETAGEGGAWGMALLAAYMRCRDSNEKLSHYLENRVFAGTKSTTEKPLQEDIEGFRAYMKGYKSLLPVEKLAGEQMR